MIATATDGIYNFSYDLSAGQNLLSIKAESGGIKSVSIFDANGFYSLRQPRISGLDSTVLSTPIPFTILLLAPGLLGLWAISRKLNK